MESEAAERNINEWLSGNYDETSKRWIREMQKAGDEQALVDAFYRKLDFGTGGMRAEMGVGTNRMNVYTVRAITQGLANYLNAQAKTATRHSVLIGYDSRNNSKSFAEECAKVLAANNIEVFLFNDIRPVALVSFGVLHKKCTAGIMITASHNPPIYNGYKVYWSDGVQVLPPHDKGITLAYDQVTDLAAIQTVALDHPLIQRVDKEIDAAYLKATLPLAIHNGQNHSQGASLHVVYTPLHGTGITLVPEMLKGWGFTQLTLVDSQIKPDGNFPTVKVPNPEESEALKEGIAKLKAVKGDILLATDPDADRIAAVELIDGVPYHFNGNEMACILLYHILTSLKEFKLMPPKPVAIKTIVTSELFRAIAHHFDVNCLEVLTGFKYIGQKISQWDEERLAGVQSHHFLFGGEESYGYLFGTHARDKDGVIISALIAEAALAAKVQGKSLRDLLFEIYHHFGVHREKLVSFTFEGREGMEKIKSIMQMLRTKPPTQIHGKKVVSVEDYLSHTHTLESGHKEPIVLPKSDVIRLFLEDGTKIVVRPSGTEPKLKIYCGVSERHFLTDTNAIGRAAHEADRKIEIYLEDLKRRLSI